MCVVGERVVAVCCVWLVGGDGGGDTVCVCVCVCVFGKGGRLDLFEKNFSLGVLRDSSGRVPSLPNSTSSPHTLRTSHHQSIDHANNQQK